MMEDILLKLRGLLSEEEFEEYDRFYLSPIIEQNQSAISPESLKIQSARLMETGGESEVRAIKNSLAAGKGDIPVVLDGKTGLSIARVSRDKPASMDGKIAFITGAAGAIGHGICKRLLKEGCYVAVSDVNNERLSLLFREMQQQFKSNILAVKADVSERKSVSDALDKIVNTWGGLDYAIVNAGVAHVASLDEMKLEEFQRLQKINVEGTLITISEVSKRLQLQGIGGDIVLISTKNVFAPGAGFGAYSATKAASHQLARIASLELAGHNIRVNMVSPDAVFSDGVFKSGLWQEVGPGRMKARGLDAKGLEDYYQNRNLLKAKVTARHVGNAVVFFLSRQTPTTGATIPVDGGLPDATPR